MDNIWIGIITLALITGFIGSLFAWESEPIKELRAGVREWYEGLKDEEEEEEEAPPTVPPAVPAISEVPINLKTEKDYMNALTFYHNQMGGSLTRDEYKIAHTKYEDVYAQWGEVGLPRKALGSVFGVYDILENGESIVSIRSVTDVYNALNQIRADHPEYFEYEP